MNSSRGFLSGESYIYHASVKQGALLYTSLIANRFYAHCNLRIKIFRIEGFGR